MLIELNKGTFIHPEHVVAVKHLRDGTAKIYTSQHGIDTARSVPEVLKLLPNIPLVEVEGGETWVNADRVIEVSKSGDRQTRIYTDADDRAKMHDFSVKDDVGSVRDKLNKALAERQQTSGLDFRTRAAGTKFNIAAGPSA